MAPRNDHAGGARASEEHYRSKRQRRRHRESSPTRHHQSLHDAPTTSESTTTTLSASALAKLDALNAKQEEYEPISQPRRAQRKEHLGYEAERRGRERRAARREQGRRKETEDHNHYREPRKSRRVVSGPLLEDGDYGAQYHRSRRKDEPPLPGGDMDWQDEEARRKKKRKWICRCY